MKIYTKETLSETPVTFYIMPHSGERDVGQVHKCCKATSRTKLYSLKVPGEIYDPEDCLIFSCDESEIKSTLTEAFKQEAERRGIIPGAKVISSARILNSEGIKTKIITIKSKFTVTMTSGSAKSFKSEKYYVWNKTVGWVTTLTEHLENNNIKSNDYTISYYGRQARLVILNPMYVFTTGLDKELQPGKLHILSDLDKKIYLDGYTCERHASLRDAQNSLINAIVESDKREVMDTCRKVVSTSWKDDFTINYVFTSASVWSADEGWRDLPSLTAGVNANEPGVITKYDMIPVNSGTMRDYTIEGVDLVAKDLKDSIITSDFERLLEENAKYYESSYLVDENPNVSLTDWAYLKKAYSVDVEEAFACKPPITVNRESDLECIKILLFPKRRPSRLIPLKTETNLNLPTTKNRKLCSIS